MLMMLFKDALIFTFDENKPFKSGNILVKGDVIEHIYFEDKKINGYKEINCSGTVALPGFVDAHTHLIQSFGRGLMENMSLTQWLEHIWQYSLDPESSYYSTLLGAIEAIRTGTTTVCEMITECTAPDKVVQAIKNSYLRGVVSLAVSNFQEGEHTPLVSTDKAVERTKSFIEKYHNSSEGRITTKISPVGLPAVTIELLKISKSLADRYNVGLHLHACEGKIQTERSKERFKKSEIEVLYENGILQENTQLAHVIWVTKEDMLLLSKTKTSVVQCPSSNIKLIDGITPISDMMDIGINVALGCDGAASSSSYDMLIEGRLSSFLQKLDKQNAAALSPMQVMKMLTINGAKAANLKNVGIIKPGWKADIVFIDIDQPHIYSPNPNALLANIIFSAKGSDVKMTVINGNIVYKDGEFLLFDAKEIFRRGEELLEKTTNKSNF